MEKFKGLEDLLKKRLEIINKLIKGKAGPVQVLDRLSQIIPKQVWLNGWAEHKGKVTIKGEALTLKHVAMFISALNEPVPVPGEEGKAKDKKKPGKMYFTGVNLKETNMVYDGKFNINYVEFIIILKVNYSI